MNPVLHLDPTWRPPKWSCGIGSSQERRVQTNQPPISAANDREMTLQTRVDRMIDPASHLQDG